MDYRKIDVYQTFERFELLRYRSVNTLWELDEVERSLSSEHPHAGPVSILRLAPEQSQHDLGTSGPCAVSITSLSRKR